AKVIGDIGGPNCFWVASAKALRQVGQKYQGKLLIGVEDLAKALNMPIRQPWVIPNLGTGLSYLRQLGAKTGSAVRLSGVAGIPRLVPHDGSVLMIAVHVMKGEKIIAGHAIYAYRNSIGQVRYMDR